MKNNKSIKKIIYPLVAVLVVLFAACDSDEIDPSEIQSITIDGHAYEADPQFEFMLEGSTSGVVSTIDVEGKSSNLDFSNFRLTQSHMAYINIGDAQDRDVKIQIMEGEFRIDGIGETTLFGTYTGTGHFENGYFTSVLNLAIQGGTGSCSNAWGSITETIKISDKLDRQMAPIGFNIDFAGVYCSDPTI